MTSGAAPDPEARRVEVDGRAAIEIRLFAPAAGTARGGVLIGGAMGVRQAFYRPFAQWLADQGYVVATFDYRGVGDSRAASLRGFDADLFAWARDTDAAIDALVRRAGDVPLYVVGHSLGAQLPGLLRHRDRIAGLVSIAAGSGYWRDNAPRLKRSVLYFWHVLVPLRPRPVGYFPGRAAEKVGDLPRGVVLQWRRWCLHPRYHVGAEGRGGARAVRGGPLPAGGALAHRRRADDRARHPRPRRLLRQRAAPRRARRAGDVAARRIGHFGFFRDAFAPTLWARTAGWLTNSTGEGDDDMSIRTATLNGVATIEIARPEKKNAITGAMYKAMADALDAAREDKAVRAVLITGQPGIFTSATTSRTSCSGRPARTSRRRWCS
jgi:predicted alpha/beta hydrolase